LGQVFKLMKDVPFTMVEMFLASSRFTSKLLAAF
jgi:hypothetical protein